jgi:DNA-binding protein Fis
LCDIEREHIKRVMEHTEGQKKKAAEILGIDVKTLYRKLKQYDIC